MSWTDPKPKTSGNPEGARHPEARKVGASWQLQEIIRTLAERLTPDEQRLKQTYYEAGYYVSHAFENTLSTEDEKLCIQRHYIVRP